MDVIRFCGFEVLPRERRLLVAGVSARIGARAFDVLMALIERQGRLVTKHELMDLVWPNVNVEEANLFVQIGNLRKVLGEQVIATVPGRGYQFTAPGADQPSQEPLPPADSAPRLAHAKVALVASGPSLIGREDDLAALSALSGAHPLLTITGAGGIGKTRLARQLAQQSRDAGEIVTWIELAGLVDPDLVAGSIAAGFGVGSGEPLRGLIAALRGSSQLVVLDNAEHVVDAVAALLKTLFDEAPRVRWLLTSQVSLHLDGERVYRLGPLDGPEGPLPVEEARTFGAIALFAERAEQADRRFALNATNVADVVAICAQLDGLPLAIELAAARVPLLGVSALARALDQRMSLLTVGRRGAPLRQATLRGALEWSHDLLRDIEQTVFRRLAAFAGDFTLEEARRVAAGADDDEWEIVDALGVLLDHSLVAVDSGTSPRYRMLESPRLLGLEKLQVSGEVNGVRRRLAECLMVALDGAPADVLRLSVRQWLARYGVDVANLRAALDWAFGASGDAALGVALSARSSRLWLNLNLYGEGLDRLTRAARLIDVRTAAADVYVLYRTVGIMLTVPEPARALVALDQAEAALQGSTQTMPIPEIALGRARALAALGRLDEAQLTLDDLLPVVRDAGFARPLASHAEIGAFVAKLAGDLGESRRRCEDALRYYRQCGDEAGVLGVLGSLADSAWAQGDVDIARSGFENVTAAMRREQVNKSRLGISLTNLAGACIEQGDFDAALAAAREGLPLRQAAGSAWGALDPLALRSMLVGRAADAARIVGYADAEFARRSARRQPNEARARARLESLLVETLGIEEAARMAAEGAALSEESVCALALVA